MTEHNSKLTSAQVDQICRAQYPAAMSSKWRKQHCRCNEVEHGGVTNKCFTSAELLYNTADKGRLESQLFKATCFPFVGRQKLYTDVYLKEDKLPAGALLMCGPLLGEVPSYFYDSDSDN